MRQQINEIKRMQQLAGLIKENQEVNEAPTSLTKTISDLYRKVLKLNTGNDEAIDDTMEKIVQKVGHTPEQKKKKGFYKFAFGRFPEFETLTDPQLKAIEPFLEAVLERGDFDRFDNWDGTKIVSDDEGWNDDN